MRDKLTDEEIAEIFGSDAEEKPYTFSQIGFFDKTNAPKFDFELVAKPKPVCPSLLLMRRKNAKNGKKPLLPKRVHDAVYTTLKSPQLNGQ